MHVTIDGYGGNYDRLADDALVRELLDRYPGEIEMTKISEPYVYRYSGVKPEDWGVSGFVIIAESHISMHTFPEHGYVWVDVFSCKGFDATRVIENIKSDFGLEHVEVRTLERGLEYPHNIPGSIPLSRQERAEVAPVASSAR